MRKSIGIRHGWVRGALGAIVAFVGASNAWADDNVNSAKAVYALTNEATGNRLAVFARDGRGMLTPAGFVPTGGLGTGENTQNQGGLAFSDDRRFIYAVNPGDNTITVFSVTRRGPVPVQQIESGGQLPNSLAVRDNLLYVLNAGSVAGGVDNIAGFRIGRRGALSPIPNSSRPLSAPATGAAQVAFSRDGNVLIVTERLTNRITTFTLDKSGVAGTPQPMTSAGATPFGFKVNRDGFLIISDAAGGANGLSAASSYAVNDHGTLSVISGSVPTLQTAACWVAVTENGRYAYTGNAGSGTITGFAVGGQGTLTRIDGNGGTVTTGGAAAAPTEMAILENRVLYVLNRGSGGIGVFWIQNDGTLVPMQNLEGVLPETFGDGLLAN
ncbi:MAG: beta-propeller fold lactonase family protein [Isosphaeraceae bacterium]|nr:beta-propeller fold lactonase family protein [Isosphaeraceae bacterium]